MGDRVLMQIYSSKRNEFGPVCYGHWAGESAPDIVRRLAKRMDRRRDDVEYATARLIQEMCGGDARDTGFGCWNIDSLLSEKDTHGDAGVVLIDCSNGFKCTCIGGYLTTGIDGFPMAEREE